MKHPRRDDGANGTRLAFELDRTIFPAKAKYKEPFVEKMCRYYSYLNPALTVVFNGKKFRSKDGLLDLLREEMENEPLYPPIHLVGKDIEIAFTHTAESSEEYYTFVNGQNTSQGGTHLAAFREALVQVVRGFYKKQYDPADIRAGIEAAVCVRIVEPVFESQTKTKLGSTTIVAERRIAAHLHRQFPQDQPRQLPAQEPAGGRGHPANASCPPSVSARTSRASRKSPASASKQAKVHNKKLRDCRVRFDSKHKRREESTLFITEGDSASGSITKSRDVETQAVFSLRGKPLNTFGLPRKIVYENEEFALLQAALNIEDGIEDLRYNKVVIATDADVDGMHIRLLLLTFFLQFFPEMIRDGHLYILQTPLFRVRNKKETIYCYDDEERQQGHRQTRQEPPRSPASRASAKSHPTSSRFMIGPDMRLDPVAYEEGKGVKELLAFYMGKNTPDRQDYIIEQPARGRRQAGGLSWQCSGGGL